jgi:serine/threonine protein kinase
LKRIPKASVTCKKRIEHLHQEKQILLMCQDLPFVVQLVTTFATKEDVCLLFEYLPGQDLF